MHILAFLTSFHSHLQIPPSTPPCSITISTRSILFVHPIRSYLSILPPAYSHFYSPTLYLFAPSPPLIPLPSTFTQTACLYLPSTPNPFLVLTFSFCFLLIPSSSSDRTFSYYYFVLVASHIAHLPEVQIYC